jgi:methionyl-tRNA formyltransferase
LRTVFLGTSEFAAAVLERLAGGAHRPALVITRQDRPRGRGRHPAPPAVARRAGELSLALFQPPRVNDDATLERIAAEQPRAIIVCAFGALIKEPLLSAYELLNVHPSLLPRWRGAAPIERAIMAGDTQAGVSIMRLTAGLDSGPVCLARAVALAADDDYGALAARLEALGGELIVEVLDAIDRDQPLRWSEQDDAQATYAAKLEPEDRVLDPALPARELERVVRALHPHIGARVALADGTMLGVERAAVANHDRPDDGAAADCALGVYERDGRLLLCCREGALELLEVKPPGGRTMDGAAYVRGHALPRV